MRSIGCRSPFFTMNHHTMNYYCKYCKSTKDKSQFYISNHARCKECIQAYTNNWRSTHLDQWRATKRLTMREYREKHRDHIREYDRQYQMKRRKIPLDKSLSSSV